VRQQVEFFGVAFREDKAMIEAQQKIIDRSAGETMMTLSFDRSVAQFRRLMAKLIEADAVGMPVRQSAGTDLGVAAQ
jgi:vanillate O-demethylase monooxygenase subunit